MGYIIGLDVGGTKCAVTLAETLKNERPRILDKVQFPTPHRDPHGTLERFLTEINSILSENKLSYSEISGIGISCGGPLDSQKGIVLSPPNLPAWDEIRICSYFEEKTGVNTRLQNDANACAVAEWKWGAGKGLQNVVFLTFGTGLGAGLILDGKLYCGANDNAGEIGHVRLEKDGPIGYGKRGSCEGFCSGGGLKQLGIKAMLEGGESCALYQAAKGDPENVSAKLIASLADSGDEMCLELYRRLGENLGRTLAILCDILDPQAIILGGIFMRADHLLSETLHKVLETEALLPCKVLKAGLGENVGDFAALSIAEGDY